MLVAGAAVQGVMWLMPTLLWKDLRSRISDCWFWGPGASSIGPLAGGDAEFCCYGGWFQVPE